MISLSNSTAVRVVMSLALTIATLAEASRAGEEAPSIANGVFIENRGQWDVSARFIARRGPLTVAVERGAISLVHVGRQDERLVRSTARFVLDDVCHEVRGSNERDATYNFLIGRDEARHQVGVKGFGAVDFVSEGADVVLDWHDGRLRLRREGGDITIDVDQTVMSVWDDGTLRFTSNATEGAFVMSSAPRSSLTAVGPERFEVTGAQDEAPTALIWSTFLGGAGAEVLTDLALTADEAVVISGWTGSFDFPVSPDAFDVHYGGGGGTFPSDVYVAQLDPSGSQLLWATFLGGKNNERVAGLAIDGDGGIVVAGDTGSLDWPTTAGAFQTEIALADGYVAVLNPDGTSLLRSTFIGGSSIIDLLTGLVVDSAGNVIVSGYTDSADFPVTLDAFQPTIESTNTGVICKLSRELSTVLHATYLGGTTGVSPILAVHVTPDDVAYVTGRTTASDFPTTPGALTTAAPSDVGVGFDAFVSAIDLSSGELVASTYLGGSRNDIGSDITVDAQGRVVVHGYTDYAQSGLPAFPTTPDAFDDDYDAFEDLFITKLDAGLTGVSYSTLMGGFDRDFSGEMVVEPSGAVVIAALSVSSNFPTTVGSVQPEKAFPIANDGDFVVFRLSPDGDRLHYSTYLGGTEGEGSSSAVDVALALAADGSAIVGGRSISADFPTTSGAYDPDITPEGAVDVVVAQLSLLPVGASVYGASTPGCLGPVTIGVTSIPQLGNGTFGFTCGAAPETGATGWLAISRGALGTPLPAGGADVWVDPSLLVLLLPVTTTQLGYFELAIPLRDEPSLVGLDAYAQFLWHDDCAPGAFSASNALALTLLP